MTYDASETGAQTGKPIELYEFRVGTAYYRYTSADADIVFQTKTYEARAMQRSAFEATSEVARSALNITCERTLPLLDLFRFAPPGEVVMLTVYRKHRDDSEYVVAWMGRVLNVTWRGVDAVVSCESVHTSIRRPGLRRMYQKSCPHVLYSAPCGVNAATSKVSKSVSSVSGLNVTLADMGAYADGHFAGGYVEWEQSPGVFERRAITAQVGAVVSINFQLVGLTAGNTLTVYPGCDHTISTCNSKFANSANYGGMPYIPSKNPFDGSPVY